MDQQVDHVVGARVSEAVAARVSRIRKLSAMLDGEEDVEEFGQLSDAASSALDAALTGQTHPALDAASDGVGSRKVDTDDDDLPLRTKDNNAFLCVECMDHEAQVFCEQCHDYFCALCFGGQHRKGQRQTHTTQPVAAASAAAAPTTTTTTTTANTFTKTNGDQDQQEEDAQGDARSNSAGERDGEQQARHSVAACSSSPSSSSSSCSSTSSSSGRSKSRNICNLMGSLLLGPIHGLSHAKDAALSLTPRFLTSSAMIPHETLPAVHDNDLSFRERAKYIPVRLTYEERKRLRLLEASLAVSNYTNKIDAPQLAALPAKRLRMQLQDICGFLSGLAVAANYRIGQQVLEEKNFGDHATFFQEIFELGRRYKIMNPEKMRGEYGKLMYLMQDAMTSEIIELLGFSVHRPIRTVYEELADCDASMLLEDPLMKYATMVVAPEGKSRFQIQKEIRQKDKAVKAIVAKYSSSKCDQETIEQCLYSIADNNYHLYFERDPIDRMIALLGKFFDPHHEESEDLSLAIVSGNDGARLSHNHQRQFHYVLQSLTLWREIAHDFFRLWCLTDQDLLATSNAKYDLVETGQGLHRIQNSPRVSRAMHVLLHSTQQRLESWVGSSVIHLGDKNVPNALMFIDKYTQVGYILRPIVKTIDFIAQMNQNPALHEYVSKTFGSEDALQKEILCDFFREAFDGSGADNFFEAGSCIDGRLTSAWNWCSNLHKKRFYAVFKVAGFVGFDGKFG